MQIVIRVAVLAVCVLGALALPNFSQGLSNEHNLHEFQAELLASRINTQLMSPAQEKCADAYNYRTRKINDNLSTEVKKCFATAEKSVVTNNRSADIMVAAIRKDVSTVQYKLGNCSSLQENTAYLTCITDSFDNNMNLLDSANSRAYQVAVTMTIDMNQVEQVRQACTNSAVGHAKLELVQSGNQYTVCLNSIRQQAMIKDEKVPQRLN